MLSARAPPIPRPAADDGEDAILFVDELTLARRGVRTLIAMPAYNEGLVIGSVVLQAQQHALEDHEVLRILGKAEMYPETSGSGQIGE